MTSKFSPSRLRVVYTLAVFTSAFLLFQIQPMMAKLILPWLGGSPAVWQTSILFFQVLLLGGYFYVHISHKFLSSRQQSTLHLVLLGGALLFLPIKLYTDISFDGTERPIEWLLLSLTFSVSLPFFVLSASAPLLQRWFAEQPDPSAHNPYFLYSASNLGSLIALVSYPFVVEPLLGVSDQRMVWTGIFALFACLMIGAVALLRKNVAPDARPIAAVADETEAPITMRRRLRWLLLAFVPSGLMLSVTTYITTDIAAVPLLFIIPLAFYLLSFVLVFAKGAPGYQACLKVMPLALIVLAFSMTLGVSTQPLVTLGLHISVFFLIAMACHGQLAEARPGVSHLTEYFVWMSFGGALGGLFNAVIAPEIFNGPDEYAYLILAATLLIPFPKNDTKILPFIMDYVVAVSLLLLLSGLVISNKMVEQLPGLLRTILLLPTPYKNATTTLEMGIFIGCTFAAYFFARQRPVRLVLCLAMLIYIHPQDRESKMTLLHTERNFFGISVVINNKNDNVNEYRHGTTLHGIQSQDPAHKLEVSSYYYSIREMLDGLPETTRNMPISITGLGAGTLTCYGKKDQQVDVYEIDRAVERIASNPEYFTYLRDCPAHKTIILGDARIKLQQAPEQHYGIMFMDAYSSDALPLHLLTKEALAIYLSKLAPEGILAFHISNRNLNLEPVLANLAADAHLVAFGKILEPDESIPLARPSQWVIMAREEKYFGPANLEQEGWKRLSANGMRLWTDDFTNIVSIFK